MTELLADEPLRVQIALVGGVIAAIGATVVSVWALGLRVAYSVEEARRKRTRRRWTTLLLEAMDGENPDLPALRRWDRRTVIGRYNYIFETLAGDAHLKIRWLAYAGRLDRAVIRMIEGRNAGDQLSGLVAAGHLRLARALPAIHKALKNPRPAHSLAAAHALVRINPDEAPLVVEDFAHRADWHVARVSEVLNDARLHIGDGLTEILRSAPSEQRPRIIALIEAIGDSPSAEVLREILRDAAARWSGHSPTIAGAVRALSSFHDPRDSGLVSAFHEHPDPFVRRNVAVALGRLGGDEEVDILQQLLQDESSWVRYEAGRAIVALPGMTDDRVQELIEQVRDPAARSGVYRALEEMAS